MIVGELTYEDILQVLEHMHDYCVCCDKCIGCAYCVEFTRLNGSVGTYCAVHTIPAHWNIDEIKNRAGVGGDDNERT